MMSLDALLNALDSTTSKPRRSSVILIRVLLIGVVVMALVFLAGAAYAGWHGWQTGDWSDTGISATSSSIPFFIAAFLTVGTVLGGRGGLNQGTTNPEQLAEGARVLREAAQAGDERIAPLATLQPALLVPEDIPAGPFQIAPLKRPGTTGQSNRQQNNLLATVVILPFLLICAFLPALVSLPFTDLSVLTNPSSPIYAYVLYATLGLIAFVFIVAIVTATVAIVRVMRGRRFAVTVDEQGVSWVPKGRGVGPVHLRWDQIRSLSRIGNTLSIESGQTTSYMLEGPEASLVWTVGTASGPDEFAASEALLRLAVTKTGKPLRDLTAISRELMMAGGNVLRLWATRVPAGSVERARPSGPLLGMQLARAARRRPRYLTSLLVGLLFVVLIGGVFAGEGYRQQYQSRYFANLPARLHAEHALFEDSLMANDGIWPAQAATSEEYAGYAFTPQGYQLSGNKPGNTVTAYAPNTYTDAAVEATTSETGTPSSSNDDGIGLILHSDAAGYRFMVFQVKVSGEWELWSYRYVDANGSDNWNYLDGGTSQAINTGQGATNRLLVVMRGGVYLLYANDLLLATYYDRYHDQQLNTSGYFGLYLNDSAMVGTFTNFAVYPVKSPPALEYV